MANRCTLHKNSLEDFQKWLVADGWEIEKPKGIFEVLRARKAGRPQSLIVYTKAYAKEHLTVMSRDIGVVRAFLRAKKKLQTNADRIRSMTNEELAEWITNMCEFERHGEPFKSIYNLDTDNEEEIHDSYGDLLSWLKAESNYSMEQEDGR